mmetsp:Transcript_48364/g.121749  ORF Transcript_48364/g.121749 Transcript_48364/m.121749 type:complete len:295 (-) Transcript_48364:659-1543(-)
MCARDRASLVIVTRMGFRVGPVACFSHLAAPHRLTALIFVVRVLVVFVMRVPLPAVLLPELLRRHRRDGVLLRLSDVVIARKEVFPRRQRLRGQGGLEGGHLGLCERIREDHSEAQKQIPFQERVFVLGHALALHLFHAPARDDVTRRHLQRQLAAVQVGNVNGGTTQGLSQRHVHGGHQVASLALKAGVLLLCQHDNHVAVHVLGLLVALTLEHNLLLVVHAGPHIHLNIFLVLLHELSFALMALVLVEHKDASTFATIAGHLALLNEATSARPDNDLPARPVAAIALALAVG